MSLLTLSVIGITILAMPVTNDSRHLPWLLLLFRLPSSRASQRVEVWRKLRRHGTLALRSSGHVLPNTPANQEKLEWLARSIRAYKGQASVVQVQAFDDLSDVRLRQLFIEARSQDYQRLLHLAKKLLAIAPARRPAARLTKLRRKFQEVAAIDFFDNPLRSRLEMLLTRA